jgi:hypothetical protein
MHFGSPNCYAAPVYHSKGLSLKFKKGGEEEAKRGYDRILKNV